ncbi:hypothetical protein [uncultured Cedecea sp.]|nr:hypothetical protein [uncultured Cedecea sp.]
MADTLKTPEPNIKTKETFRYNRSHHAIRHEVNVKYDGMKASKVN